MKEKCPPEKSSNIDRSPLRDPPNDKSKEEKYSYHRKNLLESTLLKSSFKKEYRPYRDSSSDDTSEESSPIPHMFWEVHAPISPEKKRRYTGKSNNKKNAKIYSNHDYLRLRISYLPKFHDFVSDPDFDLIARDMTRELIPIKRKKKPIR